MASTELSRRLTAAAEAAGYGGRGGPSRLLKELRGRHGVGIRSLQTVLNWLSGERNPEPPHLRALLDALGVHGDERDEIVRLSLPAGLLSSNRPDEDDIDTLIEDTPFGGAQ